MTRHDAFRIWQGIICLLVSAYAALRLFAAFAPLVAVHSITGGSWSSSANLYLNDAAKQFGVTPSRWLLMLSIGVAFSIAELLPAVGTYFRRNDARVIFIIIEIIVALTIVGGNIWTAFANGSRALLTNFDRLILSVLVIVTFARPSVANTFRPVRNQSLSS